jgi:hypothetical protein
VANYAAASGPEEIAFAQRFWSCTGASPQKNKRLLKVLPDSCRRHPPVAADIARMSDSFRQLKLDPKPGRNGRDTLETQRIGIGLS